MLLVVNWPNAVIHASPPAWMFGENIFYLLKPISPNLHIDKAFTLMHLNAGTHNVDWCNNCESGLSSQKCMMCPQLESVVLRRSAT